MHPKRAFQFAGTAAVVSGILFSIIQFIHPANDLATVASNQWLLAHSLNFFFPIFGILGLTGIYISQMKQAGYLGFIGYLALFGAFVLMTCFAFYEAFVAPGLVKDAPEYVKSGLSVLDGEAGPIYIGQLYMVNGLLYLLGGLVFGISTIRAGVFAKWSGGLLTLGVVATLSAAVLPAMARPSAVLFSLGFASLGYLLVRKNSKI